MSPAKSSPVVADEETPPIHGGVPATQAPALPPSLDAPPRAHCVPILQPLHQRGGKWAIITQGCSHMSLHSAAEVVTVPQWGRCSDHIGRKPILLLGLAGSVVRVTAAHRKLVRWPSVLRSRCLNGVLNGILGVIKISRPQDYRPDRFSHPFWAEDPYFLPCLVALTAAYALVSFFVTAVYLEEPYSKGPVREGQSGHGVAEEECEPGPEAGPREVAAAARAAHEAGPGVGIQLRAARHGRHNVHPARLGDAGRPWRARPQPGAHWPVVSGYGCLDGLIQFSFFPHVVLKQNRKARSRNHHVGGFDGNLRTIDGDDSDQTGTRRKHSIAGVFRALRSDQHGDFPGIEIEREKLSKFLNPKRSGSHDDALEEVAGICLMFLVISCNVLHKVEPLRVPEQTLCEGPTRATDTMSQRQCPRKITGEQPSLVYVHFFLALELFLPAGNEDTRSFTPAHYHDVFSRMPKLFSREQRTRRSRPETPDDQPPAHGTTGSIVSDPVWYIDTRDDIAMSAIQTSLAVLKEGSSLATELPFIAPITGLLLQALTMRDEVKQYRGECEIVMGKLARIARIIVNVCEKYDLSEEELPTTLRDILSSLQRTRELDRIERVLKKCSKRRGNHPFSSSYHHHLPYTEVVVSLPPLRQGAIPLSFWVPSLLLLAFNFSEGSLFIVNGIGPPLGKGGSQRR
ncbi:hypothetical protein EDB89DRAFT_2085467 [Lactarius sanguifluus]|nr:hypothetical protein EDB89DRAFT_2085467 [Lactarius sanguifluus]